MTLWGGAGDVGAKTKCVSVTLDGEGCLERVTKKDKCV